MIKRAAGLFITLLLFSCNYFKEEAKPQALARVNDSYLYEEDIKNLVPPETGKEDSIAIVKSYIDRWASQKLMYAAAEVNLSKEKEEEFSEQYISLS